MGTAMVRPYERQCLAISSHECFDTSVRWRFCIDRGGTFTDCLGLNPHTGELRSVKVPSTRGAPLVGIRKLLGLAGEADIPPCEVTMGTTIATNALLERGGARCALVITEGFADLLAIGTQARPDIFALNIHKSSPLFERVLEVDARCDPQGTVLSRPGPEELLAKLIALKNEGITSVSISVIHAYANPSLEVEVENLALQAGLQTFCSHRAAREIGFLRRTETCTVDAYLTPLLISYLEELQAELKGSDIRMMQSSGRLTDAARFFGRNAIMSGPAGGVVAALKVAQTEGASKGLGFDMGGTSTDVCSFEDEPPQVYASTIAGVHLAAPSMDIVTVAAGGGSLCRRDGMRLTVGPESAGAVPGPICYGHPDARDLAVTDINSFLGRFVSDRFSLKLNAEAVGPRLQVIADELTSLGHPRSPEDVAVGFFDIANELMAEALRKVTVARGLDVRDHTLVVFGGAGGQHAAPLARKLGIKRLLFHPLGGVLSAYGMGLARQGWSSSRDLGRRPLAQTNLDEVQDTFGSLVEEAATHLPEMHSQRRLLDLRYAGTETSIALSADRLSTTKELRQAFEDEHRRRFGYQRKDHEIEVVAARVEVLGPEPTAPQLNPADADGAPPILRVARAYVGNVFRSDVPVYDRDRLQPGSALVGPAIVVEQSATIVIDVGFEATVLASGTLELRDTGAATVYPADSTVQDQQADPVSLEIFAHRFMAIAEQMGETLARTAVSPNIRERLDFSCAVFDAEGSLVANAPHIPVHLGAMGASVRGVLKQHPELKPGDVFASNDPSLGGSHLPDITVVTPVFDRSASLVFFVANRGHHADIGGITPGSMPPNSNTLDEEGVVLTAVPLVRGGEFLTQEILHQLNSAPFPARNPAENLADLQAQVAANTVGAHRLLELSELVGVSRVHRYMRFVMDDGARQVRQALASLSDGRRGFEDTLDDGTRIHVELHVSGDRLRVDFSGCSDQVEGNANTPRAVAVAAVLYVLRTLLGRPIPLNQGCLEPVEIITRPASLLDPEPRRAVCSGNVETSQRIVDVLLGAFGLAAASQGTMNNITFGNADFGYYETLAGGAGATATAAGADAVHTHMTNTRITDPEVLESRFPVRLEAFAIARGTGGQGQHRGGDGLVRHYRFLEEVQCTLLTERRLTRPFGLAGGQPGASGRNLHRGLPLAGRVSFVASAGDDVRIQTPGGGGFGHLYKP